MSRGSHTSAELNGPTSSTRRSIQKLKQVMGGQLHVLVTPFGCAVDAGNQPGPVNAAEVTVDECIAGLRLFAGPIRQAEMPLGIVSPGV